MADLSTDGEHKVTDKPVTRRSVTFDALKDDYAEARRSLGEAKTKPERRMY